MTETRFKYYISLNIDMYVDFQAKQSIVPLISDYSLTGIT